MNSRTAILIDGGFFLKRYQTLYSPPAGMKPQVVADFLVNEMCQKHLKQAHGEHDLYRILYYDCEPFAKQALNPITGKSYNFKKSSTFEFRTAFFEALKKKRKVALRLGTLNNSNSWAIRPAKLKLLLAKKITVDDLTENDVIYNLTQKRVDIKIGLDIASIALKKQVDQIILVSGDSDFVPAAKLARREGIDFILDPMYNNIQPHLFEHIDGKISHCKKPKRNKH